MIRISNPSPQVSTIIVIVVFAVVSFFYAVGVVKMSGFWDHFFTLLFVVLLVFGMAYLIILTRRERVSAFSLPRVLAAVFVVHAGVLLAVWGGETHEAFLWVPDSVNHHVPLATGFGDAVRSGTFDSMRVWIQRSDGPLTQGMAGIFFLTFGTSAIASGFALLLFKLATVFLIYLLGRDLFDEKKWGLIAAVLYGLMPTVLFYTISFYKEAAVQMLVAGVLWGLTAIFRFQRAAFVVGILCALCLIRERFYLLPALLCPALLISIGQVTMGRSMPRASKLGMILMLVALLAIFYLVYDERYLVSELPRVLRLTRENLNSLPGVDPAFNRDLFYPLAIAKSFFTPFFGLRKFAMFFDFSFLLLWGSFVHQIVSFMAVVEGWRRCRERWSVHLMFWMPFLVLLFALAYLAPYSGRQRDSLYPVIAVYAAAAICRRFSIADRRKDGYV